jgi:hypothetical protein
LAPLAQAFEDAGFQVEEALNEDGRPVVKLDLTGARAADQVTLPAGWLLTYPMPEARQAAVQAAAKKPELTMYKFPRSTAVESAGYHKTDGALCLKFRRGQVYKYAPVSQEDFRAFLKSSSKGKFFQAKIRGQGIPYEKVPTDAFEALAGPQRPAGDEVYRQALKARLQGLRETLAADDYRDTIRAKGYTTRRSQARTYLTRTQPGPVSADETSRLTRALKYGKTTPPVDATLARNQTLIRRAKKLTKTTTDPRLKTARRLVREARRQGDQRARLLSDYLLATKTQVKLDRQTLGMPMSPDFALTDKEENYVRQLVVDTAHFDARAGFEVPPARANLALKLAGSAGEEIHYTDAEWDELRRIVRDDVGNLKVEIDDKPVSAVSSNVRAKRNEPIER